MLYFIFAIYFITITSAVIVSLIAFVLGKKYKNNLYVYTGLIFLGAVINLVAFIIPLFSFLAFGYIYDYQRFYNYLLISISSFLMLYFTPLLVFKVTRIKIEGIVRIIHLSLFAIVLLTLVLEIAYKLPQFLIVRDVLYGFLLFISAVVVLYRKSRIQSDEVSNVLTSFAILTIVMSFLIVLHQACSIFLFPESVVFGLPHFNVLFLLSGSVMAIIYGGKYLFRERFHGGYAIETDILDKMEISKREREIVYLLVEGKNNKEIASQLFISEKTVKNHLYNIYKKFSVTNRLMLINRILNISEVG